MGTKNPYKILKFPNSQNSHEKTVSIIKRANKRRKFPFSVFFIYNFIAFDKNLKLIFKIEKNEPSLSILVKIKWEFWENGNRAKTCLNTRKNLFPFSVPIFTVPKKWERTGNTFQNEVRTAPWAVNWGREAGF